MKKSWVILWAVILLPIFFHSCKKGKQQSDHIFWFDKATSDSLKAAGASFLYLNPNEYEAEESDQWKQRVSINNSVDDASAQTAGSDLLFIRVFLAEGETKKVGYKITVGDTNNVPFADQSYFLQHITNLQGSVDFQHQSSTKSQLVWQ